MRTLALALAIAIGLLLFGCIAQPQQPAPPAPAPQPQLNGSPAPPVVQENGTPLPEEIPAPPAEENITNQTPPAPQPRAPAKEGEFCGGIAAFQCDEGLLCVLEGSYPDAGGYCRNESEYGKEGDTCGGSAKPCEPGLQCITSGGIGTCTRPVVAEDFHICPSMRGEVCTMEYNPVCGRLASGDTEVVGYRGYGNGCEACSKSSNAIGYYYGTCESRGK